jgi:hypothetical protein
MERPILMCGEMVRATQRKVNPKTQTRRVMHFQPKCEGHTTHFISDRFTPEYWYCATCGEGVWKNDWQGVKCPYGKVGDRLWVRETWRVGAWRDNGRMAIDYMASPELTNTPWLYPPKTDFMKLVQQSWKDCGKKQVPMRYQWEAGKSPCRIRPSIFMPRWASRILREITAIRVERVQDISEADAKAEGCEPVRTDWESCISPNVTIDYREGYQRLWDSINAKRGYSWADNPWVWVIEFRRIAQEGE